VVRQGDGAVGAAMRPWATCVVLGMLLAGCGDSIHDLVHREDLDAAKARIAHDPCVVNARTKNGKTPLHYAVTYGRPEFIDLFIERGADVNAADNTGMTPLHVAAMWERIEEARRLIAFGAKLEARDKFGDTPLQLAALHGRLGSLKFLAEAGAAIRTLNNAGLTPLDTARKYRRDEAVAFLEARDDYDD
jgi:ankyrin repeat protein